MEALLIRHAIAEPRPEDGGTQTDDALRELTPKGARRMKRGAQGLKVIRPSIDLLATSPLVRAKETAEIVAKVYGGIKLAIIPELAPRVGAEGVMAWLRSVESKGSVALVGHEPDLSDL